MDQNEWSLEHEVALELRKNTQLVANRITVTGTFEQLRQFREDQGEYGYDAICATLRAMISCHSKTRKRDLVCTHPRDGIIDAELNHWTRSRLDDAFAPMLTFCLSRFLPLFDVNVVANVLIPYITTHHAQLTLNTFTVGKEFGWATHYANVRDPLQTASVHWPALRFHNVWQGQFDCTNGQRELVNGISVAIPSHLPTERLAENFVKNT